MRVRLESPYVHRRRDSPCPTAPETPTHDTVLSHHPSYRCSWAPALPWSWESLSLPARLPARHRSQRPQHPARSFRSCRFPRSTPPRRRRSRTSRRGTSPRSTPHPAAHQLPRLSPRPLRRSRRHRGRRSPSSRRTAGRPTRSAEAQREPDGERQGDYCDRQAMKLPPRAGVIAARDAHAGDAAEQHGNLGKHNDHDSLGLFQQRPSAGWGSPSADREPALRGDEVLSRPRAREELEQLPLTVAAQTVQVSAFGDRYAKWECPAAI